MCHEDIKLTFYPVNLIEIPRVEKKSLESPSLKQHRNF